MNRIVIANRFQAVSGQFPPLETGFAVISISTPGDDLPDFKWKVPDDILRLQFHDIDSENILTMGGQYLHPITDNQAKDLHVFIHTLNERDVLVHCDAGQSRSAAVGLYMHDILGYRILFSNYGTQHHNRRVFAKIRELDFEQEFGLDL